MDNLTSTLNDTQIKQNIDALQKQGVSNDKIQSYVNNYQKGLDGNYTLKKPTTSKQTASDQIYSGLAKKPPLSQTVVLANPGGANNMGVADTFKIIPNAVGDAAKFVKEGTYGIAKRVLHDIPSEVGSIIGEQGVGSAIKNTILSAPEALVKTAWGLVPQSAKELANTNDLSQIPSQFKSLAKESGGYAKAFVKMTKAIPESISPALKDYADQIDRARQSFENHPLNELLGYVGLKQLVENPIAAVNSTKEGLNTTKDFLKNPTSSLKDVSQSAYNSSKNLVKAILPESSTLMNKVARINPSDAAQFKNMSGGKDIGTFLDERGLHGSTEDVIGKTYSRYLKSKESVDTTFEKIPGNFKNQSVTTALTDLVERERGISPEGSPSTDLARSEELLAKSKTQGLDMKEINEAKRLYERNVKTDYVRENKPTSVARANNVDSHIREFQANLAAERGFKNLPELNKETQLSRYITDKLGKKFDGQLGNNGISLSDWLVAAQIPAHPAALLELISKKIFDSTNFYGKAASALSKGTKVRVPTADYEANNPLQLPAGNKNNTFPITNQKISLPSKGVLQSQQNLK